MGGEQYSEYPPVNQSCVILFGQMTCRVRSGGPCVSVFVRDVSSYMTAITIPTSLLTCAQKRHLCWRHTMLGAPPNHAAAQGAAKNAQQPKPAPPPPTKMPEERERAKYQQHADNSMNKWMSGPTNANQKTVRGTREPKGRRCVLTVPVCVGLRILCSILAAAVQHLSRAQAKLAGSDEVDS